MTKPRIPTEAPTPTPEATSLEPGTRPERHQWSDEKDMVQFQIGGDGTVTTETYRENIDRPLTAKKFHSAIETLRFAAKYGGFQILVIEDPEKKNPIYSLPDIKNAIRIFIKSSIKDPPFRIKIFDGELTPEEILDVSAIQPLEKSMMVYRI